MLDLLFNRKFLVEKCTATKRGGGDNISIKTWRTSDDTSWAAQRGLEGRIRSRSDGGFRRRSYVDVYRRQKAVFRDRTPEVEWDSLLQRTYAGFMCHVQQMSHTHNLMNIIQTHEQTDQSEASSHPEPDSRAEDSWAEFVNWGKEEVVYTEMEEDDRRYLNLCKKKENKYLEQVIFLI